MACFRSTNAAMLLSLVALVGAFAAEANCEVDGTCQAEQGEAFLQNHHSTKRIVASELSEDEADKKVIKQKRASVNVDPAFHIGAVPVYGQFPPAFLESGQPHDEKRDYIIELKDNATDAEEQAFCSFHGLTCALAGHPDSGGVPFVTMSLTWDELVELIQEHEGSVEFVEADSPVQLIPEMPNDPNGPDVGSLLETGRSFPWGITRVKAEQRGMGVGVSVYVLDTGVNIQHTDFGGRAFASLDMTTGASGGQECAPSSTTCAIDVHGHGTHCAGTIAGNTFGVASGATIHGVKVLSDSGSGFTSWILGAIDFITTKHTPSGAGPAVLSMSLGGPGVSASYKSAIDVTTAQGLTVVVAAGNENDDACQYSPAYVPNAITVGSTTESDSRSGFSNHGQCVQLFAPGSLILSASHSSSSGAATMSGTSMACPHVAGAAAWYLGADPSLTMSQLMLKFNEVGDHDMIQDARGTPNLMLTVSSIGTPSPGPSPGTQSPVPTEAPTPATTEVPTQAPTSGGQCTDTDNGAADSSGDDCADYASQPSWCGLGFWDDADFTSSEMCCACDGGSTGGGGGAPTPAPTRATTEAPTDAPAPAPTPATTEAPTQAPTSVGQCTDTNNGADDSYGDDCGDYTSYPSWCGWGSWDDADFTSSEMCCACGGGSTGGGGGAPTPAPTPPPAGRHGKGRGGGGSASLLQADVKEKVDTTKKEVSHKPMTSKEQWIAEMQAAKKAEIVQMKAKMVGKARREANPEPGLA